MITILGASGKVGSKIVEFLKDQDVKLRLVARNIDKLKKYANNNIELMSADVLNEDDMNKALDDAEVVYVLTPPDMQSTDIGATQDYFGSTLVKALRISNVKYIINLSSLGAHTEENNGIVAGLCRNEKRLNELEKNTMHLRPTYFMENHFASIPVIKEHGIIGGALIPDKKFPMIFSIDIAKVAAEYIMNKDFEGINVHTLLGPKDYSMNDVAKVFGKAIGKDGLKYVQMPYEDMKAALVNFGISESVAQGYVGLSKGINEGVFSEEERTEEKTTSTTLEEFSKIFAQVYNNS